MKKRFAWFIWGISAILIGLTVTLALHLIFDFQSNFPFDSLKDMFIFCLSLFTWGAIISLFYLQKPSVGVNDVPSNSVLANFNVNRKNLKFLIPLVTLIILIPLLQIKYGLRSTISFIIATSIVGMVFSQIPNLRVSEVENKKIDRKRQRIILLIFFPIIVLLITLPVVYGPFVEHILFDVFKINPETALDSIRSFLGINLK